MTLLKNSLFPAIPGALAVILLLWAFLIGTTQVLAFACPLPGYTYVENGGYCTSANITPTPTPQPTPVVTQPSHCPLPGYTYNENGGYCTSSDVIPTPTPASQQDSSVTQNTTTPNIEELPATGTPVTAWLAFALLPAGIILRWSAKRKNS